MSQVCEKLGTPDCPLAKLNFDGRTLTCDPVQDAVVVSAVQEGFSPDGQRLPKDDYMIAAMDASETTLAAGAAACQAERTRMSGELNKLLHFLGVDVDLVRPDGKRITELELVKNLIRNKVFGPGQLQTLASTGINVKTQENI